MRRALHAPAQLRCAQQRSGTRRARRRARAAAGRHYQAHVRSHFCTNLGVAGGLLLLQSVGAGSFTVDRLLQKTKGA